MITIMNKIFNEQDYNKPKKKFGILIFPKSYVKEIENFSDWVKNR